jgi:hypothetical protein
MTLSSRERVLGLAVGGIVAVLLNVVLLSAFARRNIALRVELEERKSLWEEMQQTLSEQGLWETRDAALTVKQPKLVNENDAGVQLLELIRALAKKHNVTLDNEVVGVVAKSKWYRSVPVTLDTHSSWPDLVGFLYALQKPDQFIVCEDANIQVDPSDQTKMLGHFKIARWFSP